MGNRRVVSVLLRWTENYFPLGCAGLILSLLLGTILVIKLIWVNSGFRTSVEITNKMQPCNRIYYSKILLKAQHVSSGIPLIVRSSNLYLQPLVFIPVWWPAVVQPGQRPVTTLVYKPETANTIWSSLSWAVCRWKHVEPSIKFWNNKFYYKVASCWLFLLIHTAMHGSMNIK